MAGSAPAQDRLPKSPTAGVTARQKKTSAAHRQWGGVLASGAAARVAQGFSACAQLWVSTPQQQAANCVAAAAGVQAIAQDRDPGGYSEPN